MLSEKILFSKKQYGFLTTLADTPPGLAKDHKKYGVFFRNPSLTKCLQNLEIFRKLPKFPKLLVTSAAPFALIQGPSQHQSLT